MSSIKRIGIIVHNRTAMAGFIKEIARETVNCREVSMVAPQRSARERGSRHGDRGAVAVAGRCTSCCSDSGGGEGDGDGGGDGDGDGDGDPAAAVALYFFIINVKEEPVSPSAFKKIVTETFLKEIIKLPFTIGGAIATAVLVALILVFLGVKS